MNVVEFIRKEFCGWGKYERVVFPAGIVVIILLSLYMKDSQIALISAICGITYTIPSCVRHRYSKSLSPFHKNLI